MRMSLSDYMKLKHAKDHAIPLINSLAHIAESINCNRFNCVGTAFVEGNDCEGCPLNIEDHTDVCDVLIDAMQTVRGLATTVKNNE